ncbi:MAG TPA: D-alanyl-D-alanine endopeptidase [Burkholderiaceae bacterium]|nr:D-alanyl-D-alanine endopeptidase [Burkholderiaceae bacterium]
MILFSFLACMLGLGTAANAQTTSSQETAGTHTAKKTSSHTRHTTHHRTRKAIRHKTAAHGRVIHRKRLHTVARAGDSHQVSYNVSHESKLAQRIDSSSAINSLTRHTPLRSEAAFVQDLGSSAVLYSKNSDQIHPIASISKLMTAIIVLDAHQDMNQILEITEADVDNLRHSRSRLRVGTRLSRHELLHLALMSSENRAAHALARNYPGGMPAFVRAMNDKARTLGMRRTHFIEPTGLSSDNVSTPRDLVKLLVAASKKPLIHRFTTDTTQQVTIAKGRTLVYNNTNALMRNPGWHKDIEISKTGFINEAGECLVMLAHIDKRPIAIVLLDSTGSYSRFGDAIRVRQLVEKEFNVAML